MNVFNFVGCDFFAYLCIIACIWLHSEWVSHEWLFILWYIMDKRYYFWSIVSIEKSGSFHLKRTIFWRERIMFRFNSFLPLLCFNKIYVFLLIQVPKTIKCFSVFDNCVMTSNHAYLAEILICCKMDWHVPWFFHCEMIWICPKMVWIIFFLVRTMVLNILNDFFISSLYSIYLF